VKRFREVGLDKNAEVATFGDQLTMGNRKPSISGHRNLTVVMPRRPKDNNWVRAQFGRQ
jgi:hypothetical protein